MTALSTGIQAEKEIVVSEKSLASEVGSGLVSVFSTAMMIAGMEEAAVRAAQPFLKPGQTTVGVRVNVSHVAATPMGMKVRFRAVLESVSANGKGLTFRVEAGDEAGLIGEGEHERVIVDKEKFEHAARLKLEKIRAGSGKSGD